MSFKVVPASRVLPLSLAVAAALPFAAAAQQADDDKRALDEIVVTATRTAITTDAALAPVEVITGEQIQRAQVSSLPDLLRGRAGINISNTGGAGKLSTLYMRGTESDHVLVLVDGVRVGSATSGLAAFQDIPVSMIDRIEIVRGPRSSLYGSDAIGGVIQIFTRRDQGDASFRFHVGAGSHGAREGGIGAGGSGERGWLGFDAGIERTDGINACRGLATPPYGGCFADEPDRDGYQRHSGSLRGGVHLGEAVTLQGQVLDVSGHNDYDGYYNNSDIHQRVLGAQLHWKMGDRVNATFAAGRNVDASDNFNDDTFLGDFSTRRDSASAQADVTLAEGQVLTLGYDRLRDRVDGSTRYIDTRHGDRTVTRRSNRAAFAQYQGAFGTQELQLALRRDNNDQFGGKTTGTAAWGVSFADHWRITASAGTAFKAPTFNELYYPGFGNPDLRPESSRTLEAGIAWHADVTTVHLDAYDTRVRDLIAYDSVLFMPNNIDRARLRGAEVRVDSTVFGWEIAGNASWARTENRSQFNNGNTLPRRATRTARLDLDRAFGDVRIGVTGLAESSRYDDLANAHRLGGFGLLDLRAEYRIAAAWTLQAKLANVFDKHYETARYYNQPGREWSLMLRFQPAQ